jgi:cell division initiation protein
LGVRTPVTPLDIRKRSFSKKFRGYDISEVTMFLEGIGEDLEELYRNLDELERENNRLREENGRHRETESTLKETLLLAQRSAEGLRTTTEREAAHRLTEAEHQGERLMSQAMERAAEVEKKIRELRVERKNFHLKLQSMIDLFQQVLNFDKEEDDLEGSVHVLRSKRREEGSA